MALFRYVSPIPERKGLVVHSDVRHLGKRLAKFSNQAKLVLTSPPYLDTTNYREDQWLRLWFLETKQKPRQINPNGDDRHRNDAHYWSFLTDAWRGIDSLVAAKAHFVIRIGGKRLTESEACAKLTASLKAGLRHRRIQLVERQSSAIVGGQLHSFRPGANGIKVEYDYHYEVRA
jgi:hypothetical protein